MATLTDTASVSTDDRQVGENENGNREDEEGEREQRPRQQLRHYYCCCCGSRCVDEDGDMKKPETKTLLDQTTQTEPTSDDADSVRQSTVTTVGTERAKGRRKRCGRKGRRSSDLSINTELYGLKSLFGSGKVFAFGMNLRRSSSFESQRDEARLAMGEVTTDGRYIERSYDDETKIDRSYEDDKMEQSSNDDDEEDDRIERSHDDTVPGPIITIVAE